MKISVVSPMAIIVSIWCVLCVRVFGVYSCLVSSYWFRSAGFETLSHVREVRVMDSNLLLEEDCGAI